MKVSVLIPAFNAGRFIGTALASVQAQTHPDWEVIVVEDGSHDDTEAVVRGFGATVRGRVVYENLGRNRGVAAVRNRLLELATGQALAFLDADDAWTPDHLANAVDYLRADVGLIVSGIQTFDLATRRPLEAVVTPPRLVSQPVLTLFEESVIITSSAVVLQRGLARRVGPFDLAFRIGEDRDYWLRCALAGARFGSTDAFTCNYAKHTASSMARTALVTQQIARFYEKYRFLPGVPARTRRHLLAKSLLDLGRLLRERDAVRSAACLLRAWRCEPFNPRIPAHLVFTGWRSMASDPA